MSDDKERKTIRDSFSIPADDHQLIGKLQRRALDGKVSASKSEVVRAGLHALDQMSDDNFQKVLGELEKIKPGRPPRKTPDETDQ